MRAKKTMPIHGLSKDAVDFVRGGQGRVSAFTDDCCLNLVNLCAKSSSAWVSPPHPQVQLPSAALTGKPLLGRAG